MTERPDAELIAAVLEDGSQPAFESIMSRYQDRIFRLLTRYTRDRGEVEDLGQEVFVKVFHKLHTFQQDSGLYTWIYRIAVNTANDHFARRKRRRMHLVGEAEELDLGVKNLDKSGSAQPILDEEVRQVTRDVLDTLSEKYRAILILREYEDLSYTDIAEVLGCSIGTVESRLFRARHRFKEALNRMHPDLVPGRLDTPAKRVRKAGRSGPLPASPVARDLSSDSSKSGSSESSGSKSSRPNPSTGEDQ